MATGTLISEEEYLNTSYEPDCEYEDGVLIERNVGKKVHGRWQAALSAFFFLRQAEWKVGVYTETRVRIRHGKYMIPDLCVVAEPEPPGDIITEPPLLWIEILSPDDRPVRVNKKVKEILASGCPYVWVIDPDTLESELHTPQGSTVLADGILRIPGPAGVEIVVPLGEVLKR